MSDLETETTSSRVSSQPSIVPSNIIPLRPRPVDLEESTGNSAEEIPTPKADEIIAEGKKLDLLSKYKSPFDYDVYKRLEKRFSQNPIRGGIVLGTGFRLANAHSTCQQCLYSFELDSYGRGCVHDCVYCYAKAQLTVHGYWNNPMPVPIDVNEIRKTFYTVFETEKKSKWRAILEKRIPLRIGSMSDSFMWLDEKYKVTQELLRILKFYKYPNVIFTRSDLVAKDEYISLMDPKLSAIQFSISSTNEDLLRKIERGAPSAKRRLEAIRKLSSVGFWTTVRINPLFPIYPDGFYTDPEFKWDGEVPKFEFSSFEMVDEMASYNVPAILTGFGRFSSFAVNNLTKVTGTDFRQFFRRGVVNKSDRDFHFSDKEIRFYYERIKERCVANKIQFTTCYIGNGESHFWKDQNLWSNKRDCCNIKSKVPSFQRDCREIPFSDRLALSSNKCATPSSDRLHDPLGLKLVKLEQPSATAEPAISL